MSSIKIVGITIAIFVVAALLYLQSRQSRESFVPGDLSKTPPPPQSGSVPLSQQRPSQTPTGGSATMPREALAAIKDLRELDSKIVTWLDAASQRERETPGALTGSQRQERVMLAARLNDIRDQIGTGVVTDTWNRVSGEIRHLRDANAGWGQVAPSLEAVNQFGKDSSPDSNLTPAQFAEFNSLFNSAIREFQGLAQPDPLQKVRLQQLQVIRQELMDAIGSKGQGQGQGPPIKMGSAQLFLRQMLKPDQPLPSLIDFTGQGKGGQGQGQGSDENTMGSLMSLVILGRPKETLQQHYQSQDQQNQWPEWQKEPRLSYYDPNDIMRNTAVMCARVREAFGHKDAAALGCPTPQTHPFGIRDKREAESVMRVVCSRIRESVPTVTPEQFGCGDPL